MKKICLLVCLICFYVISNAQERFEVFYVAGNYNFMEKTSDTDNKNYESALLTQFRYPYFFKDSSMWYTQINYHIFDIDNRLADPVSFDRFQLHGFLLRTGYIKKFNSKQSLVLLFTPRYMTDFNASFSDSFQPGGMILYEKIKNKNLMWRAGLMYNGDFFGPYFVPILDLDWKITKTLRFTGSLPIFGELFFQPGPKFAGGLHFIGITSTYRIDEPTFENTYVDRRSIDLSLFSRVHLFSHFFLTARFGYSLTRDYGLYEQNDKMQFGMPLLDVGDDRTRLNEEYEGSPFVHLRISLMVPKDRKKKK
jgi:hypothetical protein